LEQGSDGQNSNGSPSDYSKPRKADAIVSFMKKYAAFVTTVAYVRQLTPSVTEVTKDNLATFSESDKVVVVGYFSDADSDAYKAFKATAEKLREEYTFGACVDAALGKDEGTAVPGVVLYKKFDEKKNVFPANLEDEAAAELSEDDITKFVHVNSVPVRLPLCGKGD
jgi:protein disulfide-isomerase A1